MTRLARCKQLTYLIVSAIALAPAGCSRTDVTDYVPEAEVAKRSLAAALDAWKTGREPENVGATAPAVQVQDSTWKSGQKLVDYEILGSEQGNDQNLRFRVKLSIAGGKAPQEVVYVVLGKDPIWVFNQANYEKTSGL